MIKIINVNTPLKIIILDENNEQVMLIFKLYKLSIDLKLKIKFLLKYNIFQYLKTMNQEKKNLEVMLYIQKYFTTICKNENK